MSRGAINLAIIAALLIVSMTGAGLYVRYNTEKALNEFANQLEAEERRTRLRAYLKKYPHQISNTRNKKIAEKTETRQINIKHKSAVGVKHKETDRSLGQNSQIQHYNTAENSVRNSEKVIKSVQTKAADERTEIVSDFRSASESKSDEVGYRGFVSRPSSLTGAQTTSALGQSQRIASTSKKYFNDDYQNKRQATVNRLNALAPANSSVVRTLQTELHRLGCYRGRIDGIWGRLSEKALISFKKYTGAKIETGAPSIFAAETVLNQKMKICRQPQSPRPIEVKSVQNYNNEEIKLQKFRRCLAECRARDSDELSQCVATC